MDFEKLLEELTTLDLPSDQFAITGSGPLAVRGIRQAHDLDILISSDLFSKLSKKYQYKPGPPCDKITIGNIDLLANFDDYQESDIATVKEQINTADIIGGVRFVNLVLIKKFKQQSARPKDLEDIKLIEEYLKINS